LLVSIYIKEIVLDVCGRINSGIYWDGGRACLSLVLCSRKDRSMKILEIRYAVRVLWSLQKKAKLLVDYRTLLLSSGSRGIVFDMFLLDEIIRVYLCYNFLLRFYLVLYTNSRQILYIYIYIHAHTSIFRTRVSCRYAKNIPSPKCIMYIYI